MDLPNTRPSQVLAAADGPAFLGVVRLRRLAHEADDLGPLPNCY